MHSISRTVRQRRVAQGGFTLIETLIAVLILTVAIAGPLTIASKGLLTALVAKDQITAYYLAQDAVEFIRYARDTNRLAGTDWIAGGGGATVNLSACTSSDGCYFESTLIDNNTVAGCSIGGCVKSDGTFQNPLYYNPTYNRFTYDNSSSNTKSIFARQINITTVSSTEVNVKVVVYWRDVGSTLRSVTIVENLLNWE